MSNERAANKVLRVQEEPDFVNIGRYDFSLANLLERYPGVCPDKVIAQALCIDESSIEKEYQRIVRKLRGLMGVSL